MDYLPDFSKNKSVIKAKIEGAYRERKRASHLYNLTLAACMTIISVGFALLLIQKNSAPKKGRYEDFLVIELPDNFSVSGSGDITLINESDYLRLSNE